MSRSKRKGTISAMSWLVLQLLAPFRLFLLLLLAPGSELRRRVPSPRDIASSSTRIMLILGTYLEFTQRRKGAKGADVRFASLRLCVKTDSTSAHLPQSGLPPSTR